MATANHVLLQRVTLTANASSVTFDSIPQTGYTDLKIVGSARTNDTSSYGDAVIVRFNGSNTGLSSRRLYGQGGAAASVSSSGNMYAGQCSSNGQTSNTFGNFELYIPNYTSSNQKSSSSDGVNENNAANAITQFSANLWTGTSAITSVTLLPEVGSSLLQYSAFSLYGIANVNTNPTSAPKADGGDIIKTDGTYWYHAFLSSGVFRPQVGLTADVLVVAGGGGAGYQNLGAAGGAGGLCYQSSRTLTTTNYALTIGAGGASAYPGGGKGASGTNSTFDTITAIGGGGGGGNSLTGLNGGSGGAGGANGPSTTIAGGSATQGNSGGATGYGNAGGSGYTNASSVGATGGGGGAGAAGTNGVAPSTGTGGNGGNGLSGVTIPALNAMGSATSTGQLSSGNYYYAGGGAGAAGGAGAVNGSAGLGGGGAPAASGTANTGGGAGASPGTATNGGSGIIIIRYPVA